MRAYYRSFPIWNAVRTELSWTHYRIISRVENDGHQQQYMQLSIDNQWDTRTLQRNIQSQYLNRTLAPASTPAQPHQFIKDPYIFEFLNLPSDVRQTESTIEAALINHCIYRRLGQPQKDLLNPFKGLEEFTCSFFKFITYLKFSLLQIH